MSTLLAAGRDRIVTPGDGPAVPAVRPDLRHRAGHRPDLLRPAAQRSRRRARAGLRAVHPPSGGAPGLAADRGLRARRAPHAHAPLQPGLLASRAHGAGAGRDGARDRDRTSMACRPRSSWRVPCPGSSGRCSSLPSPAPGCAQLRCARGRVGLSRSSRCQLRPWRRRGCEVRCRPGPGPRSARRRWRPCRRRAWSPNRCPASTSPRRNSDRW